jgi:hypothetical protein
VCWERLSYEWTFPEVAQRELISGSGLCVGVYFSSFVQGAGAGLLEMLPSSSTARYWAMARVSRVESSLREIQYVSYVRRKTSKAFGN